MGREDGYRRADRHVARHAAKKELRTRLETVSRTLTQLQRENVIEIPCGRRGIVLRNPSALRQMDSGDADSTETATRRLHA